MRDMFVADSGAARGDLQCEVPCHEAHLGLCQTDDSAYIDDALDSTKALVSLFEKEAPLAELKRGSRVMVEGCWADGQSRQIFLCFAGVRLGHPRVILFTRCVHSELDGLPHIALEGQRNTMVHLTEHMLAKRFFGVQHPGGPLQTLHISILHAPLRGDPSLPVGLAAWPRKQQISKHEFWPHAKVERRAKTCVSEPTGLEAAMEAGFQNLLRKGTSSCEPRADRIVRTSRHGGRQLTELRECDDDDDDTDADVKAGLAYEGAEKGAPGTSKKKVAFKAVARRLRRTGVRKRRVAKGVAPTGGPKEAGAGASASGAAAECPGSSSSKGATCC